MGYLALSAGCMGEDIKTATGQLSAVCYFHWVGGWGWAVWRGPVGGDMPRVHRAIKGIRTEKGNAARKRPFAAEDMEVANGFFPTLTTRTDWYCGARC